jgi:hypothetical protein
MSADRHCSRATQLKKGSRIHLEAGVLDGPLEFTQRVARVAELMELYYCTYDGEPVIA